jgi:hypothetical protein
MWETAYGQEPDDGFLLRRGVVQLGSMLGS